MNIRHPACIVASLEHVKRLSEKALQQTTQGASSR
jgi:hypothetical protein